MHYLRVLHVDYVACMVATNHRRNKHKLANMRPLVGAVFQWFCISYVWSYLLPYPTSCRLRDASEILRCKYYLAQLDWILKLLGVLYHWYIGIRVMLELSVCTQPVFHIYNSSWGNLRKSNGRGSANEYKLPSVSHILLYINSSDSQNTPSYPIISQPPHHRSISPSSPTITSSLHYGFPSPRW